MNLTFNERLSLINQLEILKNLKNTNEYDNYIEILKNGYTFEYTEMFKDIIREEISEEICKEVIDILEVYDEIAYSNNILKENGQEFIDNIIGFCGFDANHTIEILYMSYAEFVVKKTQRFESLKSVNFNSHCEMLNEYKNVVEKYKHLKSTKNYIENNRLTLEEIKNLLN